MYGQVSGMSLYVPLGADPTSSGAPFGVLAHKMTNDTKGGLSQSADNPARRPGRIVIESEMISKITLFRGEAISAAHETSFYPRYETVLGRTLGVRMTFVFCSPIIDRMTGVNLGLPKAWVVQPG
jgi:hypothetical protein